MSRKLQQKMNEIGVSLHGVRVYGATDYLSDNTRCLNPNQADM